MKPSVKRKWLRALRSGKYKQAQGELRSRDNKYCCLGVLCDLYKRGQWVMGPFQRFVYQENDLSDNNYAYLIPAVRRAAGITDAQQYTLAVFNDSKKSFAFIADWIEKNL